MYILFFRVYFGLFLIEYVIFIGDMVGFCEIFGVILEEIICCLYMVNVIVFCIVLDFVMLDLYGEEDIGLILLGEWFVVLCIFICWLISFLWVI